MNFRGLYHGLSQIILKDKRTKVEQSRQSSTTFVLCYWNEQEWHIGVITWTVASFNGVVHTSTSMSFLSVAPPSPTIFRHLYLLALRRKSWNWVNWELQNKPFIFHSERRQTIKDTMKKTLWRSLYTKDSGVDIWDDLSHYNFVPVFRGSFSSRM